MHICTDESLRAGIDDPPFECFMCGHETMISTWVDCYCETCGVRFCDDAGFSARCVRDKAGLTRKQLAEKAGLKPSTIKKYEWTYPSGKYLLWLEGFVRELYK